MRRLCAKIVEVMRGGGEKQEYGRHPSGPTKMAVFGSFLVWKGPCWYWWPSIYVRAHRNWFWIISWHFCLLRSFLKGVGRPFWPYFLDLVCVIMLKMSYLISLHPLLFENIAYVKYFLNFHFVFVLVFVFLFVFVFVFVVVFVFSGWTPVLSSFRRCMKCWLECWNRRNTDVLLIFGLLAEGEGGEGGEGEGEKQK